MSLKNAEQVSKSTNIVPEVYFFRSISSALAIMKSTSIWKLRGGLPFLNRPTGKKFKSSGAGNFLSCVISCVPWDLFIMYLNRSLDVNNAFTYVYQVKQDPWGAYWRATHKWTPSCFLPFFPWLCNCVDILLPLVLIQRIELPTHFVLFREVIVEILWILDVPWDLFRVIFKVHC